MEKIIEMENLKKNSLFFCLVFGRKMSENNKITEITKEKKRGTMCTEIFKMRKIINLLVFFQKIRN